MDQVDVDKQPEPAPEPPRQDEPQIGTSPWQDVPRWRSHKVVQAAEIVAIAQRASGPWEVTIGQASGVHRIVTIEDPNLCARYTPNQGDFLVRYDDSYVAISPRSKFLDGYSPEG